MKHKNINNRIRMIVILSLCLAGNFSCKKFLDEKPDRAIATPSSLTDLDLMFNGYNEFNDGYSQCSEIASDNLYFTDASWGSISELHQNVYVWNKDDETASVWTAPYRNIYSANVIMEVLPTLSITPAQQAKANEIKGSAYFLRGFSYYYLTQFFTPPYNPATAAQDLGLPLRLNSDYTVRSVRSSVQQTFDQVIADLKQSVPLLPAMPVLKFRPCRAAAYAALARSYMVMRNYPSAGLYADSCLRLYDSLMNYNSISQTSATPFIQFNPEVIYDATTLTNTTLSQANAKIDSNLYLSYAANDLRKPIFFKDNGNGTYAFKGHYRGTGTNALMIGFTTDEMYLLRAECYARAGNKTAALQDLNTLMKQRWKTGTFTDFTAADATQALQLILTERRKELLFRGLRWADLRRLNQEPQFAVTLKRILNGQTLTLLPGSLRYVMQIPFDEIILTGMEQNP